MEHLSSLPFPLGSSDSLIRFPTLRRIRFLPVWNHFNKTIPLNPGSSDAAISPYSIWWILFLQICQNRLQKCLNKFFINKDAQAEVSLFLSHLFSLSLILFESPEEIWSPDLVSKLNTPDKVILGQDQFYCPVKRTEKSSDPKTELNRG